MMPIQSTNMVERQQPNSSAAHKIRMSLPSKGYRDSPHDCFSFAVVVKWLARLNHPLQGQRPGHSPSCPNSSMPLEAPIPKLQKPHPNPPLDFSKHSFKHSLPTAPTAYPWWKQRLIRSELPDSPLSQHAQPTLPQLLMSALNKMITKRKVEGSFPLFTHSRCCFCRVQQTYIMWHGKAISPSVVSLVPKQAPRKKEPRQDAREVPQGHCRHQTQQWAGASDAFSSRNHHDNGIP